MKNKVVDKIIIGVVTVMVVAIIVGMVSIFSKRMGVQVAVDNGESASAANGNNGNGNSGGNCVGNCFQGVGNRKVVLKKGNALDCGSGWIITKCIEEYDGKDLGALAHYFYFGGDDYGNGDVNGPRECDMTKSIGLQSYVAMKSIKYIMTECVR